MELATDTTGIDEYPWPEERTCIERIPPIEASVTVPVRAPWYVVPVFAVGVPLTLNVAPVARIVALCPLADLAVPSEALVVSNIVIESSLAKLLSEIAAEWVEV